MTLTPLRIELPAETREALAGLLDAWRDESPAVIPFHTHMLRMASELHRHLGDRASAADIRRLVNGFVRDYADCTDALRDGLTEGLGLFFEQFAGIRDPATVAVDLARVLATLHELRLPRSPDHDPDLGVDLAEAESPRVEKAEYRGADILAALDGQESAFADRVRARLADLGLSQQEFARRLGVQRSAVSMMLARTCRPQRRTVERAAEVLNMSPTDLWPNLGPSTGLSPSAHALRRWPAAARSAALQQQASDALPEYAPGAPLRSFAALALETAYLEGIEQPRTAATVRRLPASLRSLVLRSEAAAAGSDYAPRQPLRSFAAEQHEAVHLGARP